ncbi:hypothetical protein [Sphingomonas sp. dw_22]|uniref:hypothetical protein n=1 Tax=Sphingomonas sp. dw_22 TaxID=2721175 RepID=UPI001BD67372|nr:hypothetical protein [Sphingomonas sp. dw_22]
MNDDFRSHGDVSKGLEPQILHRYMGGMPKEQVPTTQKLVRDSKSGRIVVVRGVGALKGRLSIKKGIDLTKPIASQVMKGSTRKAASVPAKH